MGQPTLFFASNLKKLRSRNKWSQEELAEKMAITRSKLALLESGKTINPLLEDLVKFSSIFGIGVDTLLKIDLQQLSDIKIQQLEAGNDIYATGSNIRILATTVDKDNQDNVELVPEKAKAGYRSGYSDPEWVAELPRYSIPGLSKHRKYRIFPISGDSMLPYPDGCQIIGEYIDDWTTIKNDALCILILRSGAADVLFKQIENKIKLEKCLLAKSLNPFYQPYEIPITEVIEVWQYKAHIAMTVATANQEISFEQLLRMMQEMRLEINKIRSALR